MIMWLYKFGQGGFVELFLYNTDENVLYYGVEDMAERILGTR